MPKIPVLRITSKKRSCHTLKKSALVLQHELPTTNRKRHECLRCMSDPEVDRLETDLETDLEIEWQEALQIFEESPEAERDRSYQQVQTALHQLVTQLDLSPRERIGLETEIANLEAMLTKLDQAVIYIAVFGMVGRGKSSLLNALLGDQVFATGALHGVTQTVQQAGWNLSHETLANSDFWRVSLPGMGTSRIELIDTPGIDEVDGATREQLAAQLAKQADLILFVVAGDLTDVEYQALSSLRQASKPILLVFNKVDQYPETDRQAIYAKIRDQRVKELLSPDEIVMTAAAPLISRGVHQTDGTVTVELTRDRPQVEDLKLKILDILQREGKALVALNTMLYANDLHQRLLNRKMEMRDRAANDIIWQSTLTKAVAIALNPVLVVDLIAGSTIDIALIMSLSRLYGIPMSRSSALGLLRKIAIGAGGVTAGELLATVGLGSLKSVLGLSAAATGGGTLAPYVPVAIAQAAIAGVSSYGIGQIAKAYFGNGGDWGNEGARAIVRRILASLDETSILNRIKTELNGKIQSR